MKREQIFEDATRFKIWLITRGYEAEIGERSSRLTCQKSILKRALGEILLLESLSDVRRPDMRDLHRRIGTIRGLLLGSGVFSEDDLASPNLFAQKNNRP